MPENYAQYNEIRAAAAARDKELKTRADNLKAEYAHIIMVWNHDIAELKRLKAEHKKVSDALEKLRKEKISEKEKLEKVFLSKMTVSQQLNYLNYKTSKEALQAIVVKDRLLAENYIDHEATDTKPLEKAILKSKLSLTHSHKVEQMVDSYFEKEGELDADILTLMDAAKQQKPAPQQSSKPGYKKKFGNFRSQQQNQGQFRGRGQQRGRGDRKSVV